MARPHSSFRFTSSKWMEKLIPLILVFLLLVLLAAFVVIGLSLMGVTPSA